jgi:hypothetical protein
LDSYSDFAVERNADGDEDEDENGEDCRDDVTV